MSWEDTMVTTTEEEDTDTTDPLADTSSTPGPPENHHFNAGTTGLRVVPCLSHEAGMDHDAHHGKWRTTERPPLENASRVLLGEHTSYPP